MQFITLLIYTFIALIANRVEKSISNHDDVIKRSIILVLSLFNFNCSASLAAEFTSHAITCKRILLRE